VGHVPQGKARMQPPNRLVPVSEFLLPSFYYFDCTRYLLLLLACRMQFMDDEKAFQHTGILDPLRIAQRNFTPELDKTSEKYQKMSAKKFAAEKRKIANKGKQLVAVYIARAIDNFMKDGKEIVFIPYHFG
jgi:hypothetical protein